jgi:hypothetical protein
MPGRGGVLVLNAVAGMSQLTEIEQATPKILAIDSPAPTPEAWMSVVLWPSVCYDSKYF